MDDRGYLSPMEKFFGEIDGCGFETLDKEFESCLTGHGRVERLWTGARWVEGPVWFPAGRFLLFSDIPNNRILRWDETNGSVSEFRNPSNFSNGNTRDLQGRLITCEHLSRTVTRTEHSGDVTTIASHYNSKKLNSPNDVVVKSDGSIWFTDPDYGIMSDYEGRASPSEQSSCNVYRIDQETGTLGLITDKLIKPNGLCFNKSETKLYVSDTGGSHVEGVLEIFTVLILIGNKFHLKLQSSLRSVQMVFLMVLELIMKIEFGLQRLMVCTVIIQKVVL